MVQIVTESIRDRVVLVFGLRRHLTVTLSTSCVTSLDIMATSEQNYTLMTPNPHFEVTPLYFDAEYLRNGTRSRRSYNRILIVTYTMSCHAVLKGVISNDF